MRVTQTQDFPGSLFFSQSKVLTIFSWYLYHSWALTSQLLLLEAAHSTGLISTVLFIKRWVWCWSLIFGGPIFILGHGSTYECFIIFWFSYFGLCCSFDLMWFVVVYWSPLFLGGDWCFCSYHILGNRSATLNWSLRESFTHFCIHISHINESVCHSCWHYIVSSSIWSITLSSACINGWFLYFGLELSWIKYTTQEDQCPHIYAFQFPGLSRIHLEQLKTNLRWKNSK